VSEDQISLSVFVFQNTSCTALLIMEVVPSEVRRTFVVSRSYRNVVVSDSGTLSTGQMI